MEFAGVVVLEGSPRNASFCLPAVISLHTLTRSRQLVNPSSLSVPHNGSSVVGKSSKHICSYSSLSNNSCHNSSDMFKQETNMKRLIRCSRMDRQSVSRIQSYQGQRIRDGRSTHRMVTAGYRPALSIGRMERAKKGLPLPDTCPD